MKLVTFETTPGTTHAGVIRNNRVFLINYPTLLELLQDPAGMAKASQVLESNQYGFALNAVTFLPPVPNPPTLRDFYSFEQHVKNARTKHGHVMLQEWYEHPTFYFSNTSELYGHGAPIPYPTGSKELDFELEIACVINREGKDIPADEAAAYIAGYTIMNDWSARDFQRQDMQLHLGPSKGKDFATSLGPWLVTPDELATRRTGSDASERYDMAMIARINGQEISRGNFNQIYYTFPQMIAYASRNARLRPGDIIGSGTVGTGCLLELGTQVHPWLQPGDTVELEIEGIGVLSQSIFLTNTTNY
jgi:fumarylacetoacetate (FAA) hydrolase